MSVSSATISVILYKSKKLSNGEHPLMLRITKNRKRKYLSLGISCKEKQWDFASNKPKRSNPNRELIETIISQKIIEYQKEILELKREGKDFTATSLYSQVEKPYKRRTVFEFFDEVIKRFKTANKLGNALVYKDTFNSIKKFTNKQDITFSDIDISFLVKYETYQKMLGVQDNTISVRFRTLRALYNKAIDESIVKEVNYPFKKFKVAKFSTTTKKRALTKNDIKLIENLKFNLDTSHYEAQQYFLFSYYGQGINFVDIAHLKWENIIEDRIVYTRFKTGKVINFKLLEPANKIINQWKRITGERRTNYIFTILNTDKHITATQKGNRIRKVITRVNRDLKDIGKVLKLSIPLTTYVARHSFATVLKKSGVSIPIISEAMGHKTEGITHTYLKSFENNVMDEAMNNLI